RKVLDDLAALQREVTDSILLVWWLVWPVRERGQGSQQEARDHGDEDAHSGHVQPSRPRPRLAAGDVSIWRLALGSIQGGWREGERQAWPRLGMPGSKRSAPPRQQRCPR